MKKISFACLVFCLFILHDCFALDWKKLHEKADNQSLTQSLMASQKGPGSLEDSYVLGLAYLNQHRDKEAEAGFGKILERDPGAIEAQWGMAEALRRQHQLERAEELLGEIIRGHPGFYPAYISMAYLKYTRLDFKESARLALRVIKAGRGKVDLSNYTRAYCLYAGAKGMIAHYGGPLSKLINGAAVKSKLDRAEELQPNSAGVLFGLGSFYLLAPRIAGGDPLKSEAYLRRAIRIDPFFADAYVRLAQLYKIKGEDAFFEKYLRKALELDPGNELAFDIRSGRCRFICVGDKQ